MKKALALVVVITAVALPLQLSSARSLSPLALDADTVFTFGSNAGGGESQAALDGLSSGKVTVSGLTLSAAANTGTFNSTASAGFGINDAGTDNTTEFDGTDVMSFSFNQAVDLVSIDLNVFGASDAGFLTYSGGTVTINSDPFTFTNVHLVANEIVQFGNNSGSSFSLQSLTVSTAAAIPEPATCMLMGIGLLLGAQRLRRKA